MKPSPETKAQFKLVISGILFMIFSYVVFIFIWNVTSVTYKPANVLDLEVKTPEHVSEWLIRREHGI